MNITTAVINKKGFYGHFGIHKTTASLYGYKPEDIIELEVIVDENQDKPEPNQKMTEPDYWGFWNNEKERFTFIYSQFFLLNMCFPYGVKASEDSGEGVAKRVVFKKIDKTLEKKQEEKA